MAIIKAIRGIPPGFLWSRLVYHLQAQ